MKKQLEQTCKKIREEWPGAEVSVIQNDRDNGGTVLSVKNKNSEGLEKLCKSPDHIVVEIDPADDNHVLVIPLNQPGLLTYVGV